MNQRLHDARPDEIYPSWSRLLPLTLRGLLFPPISGYYRRRYEKSKSVLDLQHSINYAYISLATTATNHPSLPYYQQRLAYSLYERFRLLRDVKDQQLALMLQASLLNTISPTHPDILWHRGNFRLSLRERYLLFGKTEDLDAYMSLCQLTISELPAKSSDLALWQVICALDTRTDTIGLDAQRTLMLGLDGRLPLSSLQDKIPSD